MRLESKFYHVLMVKLKLFQQLDLLKDKKKKRSTQKNIEELILII